MYSGLLCCDYPIRSILKPGRVLGDIPHKSCKLYKNYSWAGTDLTYDVVGGYTVH